MIHLTVEELDARVADHPPGYREDVESIVVRKDEDGSLWIEPRDWMALLARYNSRGFGTHVYWLAHPVAIALDKTLGTHLANCGGCAQRMERWNK